MARTLTSYVLNGVHIGGIDWEFNKKIGLKELYDKCKIADDFLREVKSKVEAITECPCSIKNECIHGCLPTNMTVMGDWCADYCPFSKMWNDFKYAIYKATHKYIGV